MVTRKILFCVKEIKKRKPGVKFYTSDMSILDLEVSNNSLSQRIVQTPKKNKFITMRTKVSQKWKLGHKRSTTNL